MISYSPDGGVNPRAIAFDTPIRRLAITDGFALRRRGEENGDVWDELSRRDLKPLRLAVIGAAMSQISGRGKYTQVSLRKRDGRIAANNIPMSLPREGRYLDAAMIATEFIREAVMLEHELSDGMSVAALTDGLIIQGYDYPPVLWPVLGLKFALKENGATSIRASNCYMIGDKATLNYPEMSKLFSDAKTQCVEDPDEGRVIAIPLVMGWTAEQTVSVLEHVRDEWSRRRLAWRINSPFLEFLPDWMGEIMDRRERMKK